MAHPPRVEVVRFALNETPSCVWGVEMQKRNVEFLKSVDPRFFEWVASVLAPQLDGDNSQRAAVALRVFYGHALETLFAFIGAVIQAPECLFGWLGRYRNSELAGLVRKLSNSAPVHSRLKISPLTWNTLADAVHVGLRLHDEEMTQAYRREFGRLWDRLARDFLDPTLQAEYNSLKHGLRASPGGFSVRWGAEEVFGEPCPPEKMQNLGGSKFGSAVFVLERLPEHKYNFTNRRQLRNWMPMNFLFGLNLVALSLENVIMWARFLNGADPEELRVRYPPTLEDFSGPWREAPILRISGESAACSAYARWHTTGALLTT